MSMKVETVSVCYGCLSANRNAVPLGELSELFCILVPQTFIYENVLLCWECRSILKKTWKFQQRIQQAQILMQTPEFLLDYSTSSLSTLQLKVIDSNYDIVYKNYSDNEDKVKLEIEAEFKIDSAVDNVHYNEIEIESKEVIDTENNDLKNKQFDEYFDVLIYEKINSDDKIQIDNKDIENITKINKGKRNIEIGITPEIEKSYSDDENHEDSDNENLRK
ncbi:PREDICTED: uncharacterized protein LOC106105850 [Papilio polytes]|uniref:uncharacterized protein LOC106105850 n=1 Tax=Papilio polytes TaxID=76194 RepID=UPI000676A0B4|nr:PREDICTED: uncharacterized protein LOC106105850 [Papilio polytes]